MPGLKMIRFLILVSLALIIELPTHAVEHKMSTTKTYCIGRFLVDIPGEVALRGQNYEFKYGQINTDSTSISDDAFKERMALRANELKNDKKGHQYSFQKEITPSPHTKIFVTSINAYGEVLYSYEAYKLDHETLFSLKQEAVDAQIIDAKIIPDLVNNLLPNLRYRSSSEIPSEPGFCIENGFIRNDGSDVHLEAAHMAFAARAWPDVWYTIIFNRNGSKKLEKPLLDRVQDESGAPSGWDEYKKRIRIIRSGSRDIGSLKGQELIEALPSDKGFYTHQLTWDSIGLPNSATDPRITFDMDSGNTVISADAPIRSKSNEQQLLAYFDAIANSIRLRPVGSSKVSEADTPPILPIGELARTGTPCPQTGLWKCAEAGDVEGGRTQRFEVGAIMPQARIKRERDFWQKLKGGADYWDTDTVWQLVAHDEPAKPATEPESSVADSTSTEPRDEQPS